MHVCVCVCVIGLKYHYVILNNFKHFIDRIQVLAPLKGMPICVFQASLIECEWIWKMKKKKKKKALNLNVIRLLCSEFILLSVKQFRGKSVYEESWKVRNRTKKRILFFIEYILLFKRVIYFI